MALDQSRQSSKQPHGEQYRPFSSTYILKTEQKVTRKWSVFPLVVLKQAHAHSTGGELQQEAVYCSTVSHMTQNVQEVLCSDTCWFLSFKQMKMEVLGMV